MSDDQATPVTDDETTPAITEGDATTEGEAEDQPLSIETKIDERGACQRHVTVTIAREDIDRYFDKSFSEMMGSAVVPGFRPGRVPRKLIEHRFRKEVAERVKSSLLLDSLSQVLDEMAPISEPDFDAEAVEIPETGAMTFEFDIEVRPEFELPEWKGLKLDRPSHEFTEEDVDRQLKQILSDRGRLVPFEGEAKAGDFVIADVTVKHNDQQLTKHTEQQIQVAPTLRFHDGNLDDFDKLLAGAKAGDIKTGKMKLSVECPLEELQGEEVDVTLNVLEVKQLELPEMTSSLLQTLGDFEDEKELREAVTKNLERQLGYHGSQRSREQILELLTSQTDLELPQEMLKKQAHRELERSVLELRRNGFSDREIQAHENDLRQNSMTNTARMLKQHFLLERIAENEQIEDIPDDYDDEIRLIAMQSGESPRRVRAQLEKRNMMDVLRNQIIERKVLERIQAEATFQDVPWEPKTQDVAVLDWAASGAVPDESDIPQAKYDEEPASK